MSDVLIYILHGGEWISTTDKCNYVGGSGDTFFVDKDITYHELIQQIAETIGLNYEQFYISIACQYRIKDRPPVKIRNDRMVKTYTEYLSRIFPDTEPLYVEIRPRTPHHQSPIIVPSPVHEAASPIQMNTNFVPNYVSAPDRPPPDTVLPFRSASGSNQFDDIATHMLCTTNVQPNRHPDWDDSGVRSWENSSINLDTGLDDIRIDDDFDYYYDDSDEGTAEHPIPEMNPAANFTDIPQLPEDIHPSYEVEEPDVGGVRVGQIFDNKTHLQDTLAMHALRNKYQYVTFRSTKVRWEVKCCYDSCKWRVRGMKVDNSDCFVVRKMNAVHTCPRDQVYPNHRQATARLIGKLQKSKFQDVNRVHRPRNIMQDILEDFGINLSYAKAWRAREFSLAELMGTAEASYAILPRYCEQLERFNPGTVTDITTDDHNHFKYFFMSLGAWRRAFLGHLRKVVAVDGTFMKGKYYGTLFVAVCLDGNNQIYPLAFAVVDSENDASWNYFFSKLNECLGDVPDLVIISDRHKSIEKAVHTVIPYAHYGVCCQHLRQNLVTKYKKGLWECCYWQAAKAYRVSDFNEHMRRLQCISNDAYIYLETFGFQKWARAHFPGHRYNIMTTNIAESINSVLKYARRLPITIMAEFIRATMQKWFHERVTIARDMVSYLSRWADVKVGNRVRKSGSFVVLPVDQFVFQVHDGGKDGLVNLHERTCTCRKWQLSQLPCEHVAAVCRHLGLRDCHQWCSEFFTRETLIHVYSESIYPVPPESDWDSSEEVLVRQVLPPNRNSRPSGRPRVERVPSTGETVVRRKCGRCGQIGHNRQNCSNPMPLRSMSSGAGSSTARQS